MAENNDEKVLPFTIPANYYNQFHFMGKPYEYKFVIQTAIIVFIATLALWFGLTQFMDKITTISVILFVDVLVALLSLNGIQGDTFIGFISKVLRYRSRRRIAYYNPRAKVEAESTLNTEREMLPRDRLVALYDKYKKSFDAHHQKNAELTINNQNVDENLYFQDDIGVVDKPYEYMTRKERWEYDRKMKKQEKANDKNGKED